MANLNFVTHIQNNEKNGGTARAQDAVVVHKGRAPLAKPMNVGTVGITNGETVENADIVLHRKNGGPSPDAILKAATGRMKKVRNIRNNVQKFNRGVNPPLLKKTLKSKYMLVYGIF